MKKHLVLIGIGAAVSLALHRQAVADAVTVPAASFVTDAVPDTLSRGNANTVRTAFPAATASVAASAPVSFPAAFPVSAGVSRPEGSAGLSGAALPLAGMLSAHGAVERPVGYAGYMEQVARRNLSYAAEKLNMNIAEAGVRAARLFNDPQLSVEYGNNQDWNMQMGQGISGELSKTFSPGKRSANIHLAGSEKELTQALLDDYFRNLRCEATLAYLDALKQAELFRVKQNAYDNMRRLAEGDSVKFALGKITEVDATQSRVEAGVMRNDLLQAEAELHNAFLSLGMMLGSATDTLYLPQGSLRLAERAFPAGMLVASALENRADLVAAMRNVDVAQRAVTVARRERNMDFDLALGVNHNGTVRNEIAPAPRFTGFTVGLSVPLKFSNFNKGTVEAARYREQQAQTAYEQARLQVQTEVMQNYRRYTSLIGQVRHYDNGLLENAASVVKGKIYSYDRGETSLLEVLNAQRTYDEVRTLYIETLYNYAASLVELETSAGIWDIAVE